MKKVLIISPDCPFPPEKSGGSNALFHLMKASEGCALDLIYFGDKDEVGEKSLLTSIAALRHVSHISRMRAGCKIANRIASLLKGCTYAQYQYYNEPFKLTCEYDVVMYCQLPSVQFVVDSAARNVAFPVDYMPRYFAQQRHGGIARSIYYRVQEDASRKELSDILPRVDSMYFVSSVDAELARKELKDEKGKIASIGLGVTSPIELNPCMGMGRSLVFTGVMDYQPNEDAAIYLVKEIFPELKETWKDLRLYLVGKNPTEKLRKVCNSADGVVLTGMVDSVLPYIAGATLYVSPLRYGTGVKNKILEAMSCGAALVASPLSVEGIPGIVSGRNCIIANEGEWPRAIGRLLDDEDMRKRLRISARETASSFYAWDEMWSRIMKGEPE